MHTLVGDGRIRRVDNKPARKSAPVTQGNLHTTEQQAADVSDHFATGSSLSDLPAKDLFGLGPSSTHQTHRFWMKVREDLTHIAMAENVRKHFGKHGTVVEKNLETAWPRDAQGV